LIPITKPYLPPFEEYTDLLKGVYEREWLTNNGPLVKELEDILSDRYTAKHISYVSNGTVAIQIALKLFNLKGEIITTPFSYVATTSSICWEGLVPVFVDIDPYTYNIDATKIEDAITPSTSAVLATHVYGIPCDVEKIRDIASKYNLKVIYDAAHAFGSYYRNKPLLDYGDVSTVSFHATKLFHTIEGGAVICSSETQRQKILRLRNFGHDGPLKYSGIGINGKNSEVHAAMGLANLKYIDQILNRRVYQGQIYEEGVSKLPIQRPLLPEGTDYNYAYFPIVFESEQQLIQSADFLRSKGIFTRRYFYPLLSTLDYIHSINDLPVAEEISKRILCLPMYHELTNDEIKYIIKQLGNSF
jgi:dTDP-4-amino-4,6-dideoxygalactose transaminase